MVMLLPLSIDRAIGNEIIDEYDWLTYSETIGEEILNYPYEMLLGAARVAVFTLVPAVIVRSKDAGTRARLLAERDAAQNRQTADTEDENVQTAE